jgi:hypothetical protein
VNYKFRPSGPDEVNILGLSVFGELDRELQLVVSDWLKSQRLVDAVLIASRESRRKSGFDAQLLNDKAKLLSPLLRPLGDEDQTLAFALEVPMQMPGLPQFPPNS